MRAMILAAGLGTRLRPLTLETPKPLIPVGGKALIVYQLEKLAEAGVTEIVINHAWLGEQIESALGEGTKWGVSISYSAELEPLETAGGICKALPYLTGANDDPFLVVNGDVFLSTSYNKLRLELPESVSAKLWLVHNPSWHPEGDFALAPNGHIVADDSLSHLTFSGVSLLRPSLFKSLIPGEKAPLAPLLRKAISQGRVVGEPLPGYWNDVGTHERLAEVEALLARGGLN